MGFYYKTNEIFDSFMNDDVNYKTRKKKKENFERIHLKPWYYYFNIFTVNNSCDW